MITLRRFFSPLSLLFIRCLLGMVHVAGFPISARFLPYSVSPPIYVHCDSPLLFLLLPSFLLSASIRTLA